MARKSASGEIKVDSKVKQIVRSISKSGRTDLAMGYFNVVDVDAYVGSYLDQGYKLFNTHYLGENEMAYIVLYVLVGDFPIVSVPVKE